MSAVPPPNWLSSVLQGAAAQQRANETKAREDATTASATGQKPARFVEQLTEAVQTSDADTQVFSDAEGAGSQGRQGGKHDEHAQEQPPEEHPTEEELGGSVDFSA